MYKNAVQCENSTIHCKTLNQPALACYNSLVVAAMRTPRPLDFSPSPILTSCPRFPNSHGIISFADPHLLNLFISYRYKNHGGRGPSQSTRCEFCIPNAVTGRSHLSKRLHSDVPLSSVDATLMRIPASVDSKGFTGKLNPLDATLTKNTR